MNNRQKLITRMAADVLAKKFTGTEIAIDDNGLDPNVSGKIKDALIEAGCSMVPLKDVQRVVMVGDLHGLSPIRPHFFDGPQYITRMDEQPDYTKEVKEPSRLFMALLKRL